MFKHDVYEVVIGIEIHAQLLTQTKLFCTGSTNFHTEANLNISPVSVGEPGALPILNQEAVNMAIKAGLGLNCKINLFSEWSRKNYFYPDLPKGYQISQFEYPICSNGQVIINYKESNEAQEVQSKTIAVERIHLEEDAGKSIHDKDNSLMNYNRSSVPLIETVSKPDIRSAREAVAYCKKVRQIFMYLGICDGNMEEGSFRCDINVSIRKWGAEKLGTRSELKNINSFKFIDKAIEYEILRHQEVLESGGHIVQETRMYDSTQNKTYSMRSKEEAMDYRYFPEPDLPHLMLTEEQIEGHRRLIPELPDVKAARFIKNYNLGAYDADVLTSDKETAHFFEQALTFNTNGKGIANWIMGDMSRVMNEKSLANISLIGITPKYLASLVRLIDEQVISGKIAKQVFEEMLQKPRDPQLIIDEKGWVQIVDEAVIQKFVDQVIANNAGQLDKYLKGNERLFGFFVGQVMQISQGKANPEVSNRLIKESLEKQRG